MNEIRVFKNDMFGELRTIVKDDELWFVATDVCKALELGDTGRAVSRLDEDEGTRIEIAHPQNPLKTLEVIAVSESGLYSLVLGSRKSEAKAFKRWITHEVVPSIRKNGAYIVGQEDPEVSDAELLSRALITANRIIESKDKRLREAEEKNKFLEAKTESQEMQIAEMQPKATYFDAVLSCKDPIRTKVVARDYGWSAQHLNKWLCEHGIQYKQNDTWLLYQKYADKGYTVQLTYWYYDYSMNRRTNITTMWTQSGRLFIYENLKKEGILPLIEKYNNSQIDLEDDIEDEDD